MHTQLIKGEDFKYKYDVTFILKGRNNYGSINSTRFLAISRWLEDLFGEKHRLKFRDLGQDGYWELMLMEEEQYTLFKMCWND